jgi:hypothetical protein
MTDAIDLSTVQYHNSPNVSGWPITSELTALSLRPGNMHLEFTTQGQWPPVPLGDAFQEATFWVFLNVDGTWHGTGAERLRPNQKNKPEDQKVSNYIAESWLYDPHRWGPMARYVPRVGELVGVMVAAGDQRGADNANVRERTAVMLVKWPDDAGADFPPFASLQPPPPAPDAPPADAPPPVTAAPAPGAENSAAVLAKLDAIHAVMQELLTVVKSALHRT